jgi:hypothetical protein
METLTPEQFEQAKREFAEKWGIRYQPEEPGYYELKNDSDNCLSDLTALLEQHKEMMLEFTEWWGRICIEQHGQYNSMEIPKEICGLITMNELFEWWLKNVKK